MNRQNNSFPKLKWGQKTYVMGILNITPDSFSGDGLLTPEHTAENVLAQANEFVRDGAHILDLGAESSRPGSASISTEEELKRLMPSLKAITTEIDTAIISVDTYKSTTARACLEAGAHWINDIWALRADPELAHVIADFGAVVVLMHNRSNPDQVLSMGDLGKSYAGTKYKDLIQDIRDELQESIDLALKAGIPQKNIIVDPGIGFGKTVSQNCALINHLDEFRRLGFPILIGPSRKSFIGKTLDLPVDERGDGTAAAVAIGIARSTDIVRVHDVRRMARVAAMSDAIIRDRNPE